MSITASSAASLNVSTVPTPVAVSDSAANVATFLDSLHNLAAAHKLASIRLSDAGTPSITTTAAKLISDSDALLLVSNTTWTIALSGSATVAQVVSANSTLASKLSTGFAISDTAANVASNLDNLQSRATTIASVALSDVSPSLSMTAAQLVADSSVLLKIGGTYGIVVTGFATAAQAASVRNPLIVKLTRNLNVSDSAANVASNLNGLQAHLNWVASIALTDSSPVLTLTNAQLFADVGALLKISRSFGITLSDRATVAQVLGANATLVAKLTANFAISDTAANIAGNVDALQSHIGTIQSLVLTDASPVVSLTSVQLVSDAALLLKIGGSYGITVSNAATAAQVAAIDSGLVAKLTGGLAVSDSATALSRALSILTGLGNRLGTVTVGGPATVGQAVAIIGGLSSHLAGTIAVSDTGASVISGLSSLLAAIGKIGTIALSDSGTPLVVASGMLSTDSTVFGKIASYTLTVSDTIGTAAANTISANYGAHLATSALTVSDTVANVFAAESALQALAGKLHTVAASGPATVAQATAIASGLSSVLSGTIAISDTGANVVTGLSPLLANIGKISTITLSDSGTPLVVASGMLSADGTVFGKIASYSLTVSDTIGTALAGTISTGYGSHLATGALMVSDTAANVFGSLSALRGLAGKLQTVVVGGSATVAQANAIVVGLSGTLSGTVAVGDTGASVVAGLSGLLANIGKISTITLSDGGTPLVVASGMLSADSAVFGKIASYTLTVSDTIGTATAGTINTNYASHLATSALTVSDTAANVLGALSTLQTLAGKLNTVTVTGVATTAQAVAISGGLTGHMSGTIAITDTGANVVAGLSGLLTNIVNIGAITLSNASTPLVVASGMLSADSAVFGKIASYMLTVSDTIGTALAGTISTGYGSQLATAALTVSDSASNVFGALTALQGLAGKLNTVTVGGAATAAQANAIIGGLSSHLSGTIAVGDTGANVLSGMTGLLANIGSISTITLSDSSAPLVVASGMLTTDSAVFGKIASYTLTVSDTGANVVTGLSPLLANIGKISTITLSDSGTPLVVASGMLSADGTVFGKIASYSLTVSDTIGTALAGTISTGYGSHLATGALMVSDTAANVFGSLSALRGLAGKLQTVVVGGSATVAQANAIVVGLSGTLSGTVAVGDTGASVVAGLSGLLANIGKISTITLSDGGTPLVVASGMLSADSAVFGKIASYTLTVSDTIGTATAGTINTNYASHLATSALTVSDTAANVLGALSTLQTLAGKLNTVTVTGVATTAQAVAISGGLTGHMSGTIAITDTGANVVAGLSGLLTNIVNIGAITLSNASTPLVVASGMLSADSAVFGKIASYMLTVSDTIGTALAGTISTGYGSQLATAALTVSDSASNVFGALTALQGLAGKLNTVTVGGAATAAQANAIIGGLSSHLSGTIAVGDTGANVLSGMTGLLANIGSISTITLSDSSAPLVVASGMLTTDSAVFGKIASYTLTVSDTIGTATAGTINTNYGSHLATSALTVSDTAANVLGALSTLQTLAGKLNTVTVTGVATTAQAVAISGGLHVSGTIAINDTGANVLAGLSGLLTNIGNIGTITLSDSGTPLVVASGMLSADGAVFGKIASYTLTVSDTIGTALAGTISTGYGSHLATGALTVSDSATNVLGSLSVLQGLGGKLASVTVAGPATTVQAIVISVGLSSALSGTMAIGDTGANILSGLSNLLAIISRIGTITLSDSVTPLVVTSGMLSTDTAVFGKIASYMLTVSDTVGTATAATITSGYGSHLATGALVVSDTALNVSGALSTLTGLGSKLSTVTVGVATAAQANAIAAGLSSYIPGTIAVSDTGAAVLTALSGLQTNNAKIGTITLSDSGTPLVVASGMLTTDSAVFGKIASYTMTVSDTIGTATAGTITASYSSHLATGALVVSDTALNVSGALSTLTGLGSKLSTVTVGVGTAAQANAIAAGLSSYIPSTIAVSDTGAAVLTALGGLQTNIAKIGTITLSDSGTPLVVASGMLTADSAVFGKIASYTLTVSDTIATAAAISINTSYGSHLATGALIVSDTAANVSGNLAALQALGGKVNAVTVGVATAAQANSIAAGLSSYIPGTIAVSDTGAAVVAALGGLQTNIAKIGTITLSDSGTPLVVASGVLTTDSAVFGKIASYTLTVSDTIATAAAISINTSYGSHLATGALIVSDTAANVSGNLAALQALGGKLNAVTVGVATAAQANSIAAGLSSYIPGTIAVSDTGAAVLTALSGLQTNNAKIGTITLSDSGTPLVVASGMLTADSAVFGKIASYTFTVSDTIATAAAISINTSYGSHLATGALIVSDTAANVSGNLAALQALGGKLNAVTVGVATAAQANSIAAGLSSYIPGTIAVSDTGAAVLTALSGLQTNNAKIGTITLSDSGTPLVVASGMLTADSAVFGKIASYTMTVSDTIGTATAGTITASYSSHLATGALVVSDTALNVSGALSTLTGLGSKLSTVTVGVGTAAQANAIAAGLSSYIPGTIAVSDTGAAVLTALSGLQTNNAKIGTITLSDSGTPLVVASGMLTTDSAVFGKIASYTMTVSDTIGTATAGTITASYSSHLATGALVVSDTALNVSGALSTLTGLGSKLSTVTVGVGTAAQANAIAAGLSSYIPGTIAVSDTGAAVLTALSGLQTNNAKIGTITLSDSGTPLVVASGMLTADSAVFGKIASYTMTVSDTIGTATAGTITASYSSHLATGALVVSDTALNVSGILDTLQTLGNKVGSISLTDVSPVLSMTATQLINDAATMLKIGGSYHISVSGNATVAQVTTANTTLVSYLSTGFAVSDSVTNVGTQLDALQVLTAAAQLASITATGGGTISITATQLLNDSSTLALISGGYSLTITSGTLTAAQAVGLSPSIIAHLSAALPVSDTSTNIVSALDGLQTIAASIQSVSFSDGTPALSLTAAKIIADINVLSVASGYTLSVSGGAFTAAQATTLSNTPVANHLAASGAVVVDTAAHVAGALSALSTLAGIGKLGPITLSDVSVLPVTPTQLLADLAVFRKITNSYTFSVSPPLTAAQAASVSSLLTARLPSNLAVSDSAANVISNLDSLEGLALGSHLGSVTLSDGGTPQLHVSADQLTSDADVLAEVVAPYQLLITGSITAAEAASYASQMGKLGGAVSVLDSATAVTTNLGGLATLATNSLLSSITFTDTGTPALTLAAAAFANGVAAFSTFVGNYSVTINSGTMTAAQFQAVAAHGLLAFVSGTINVSDTGANVVTSLGGLQTNVAKIGTITLSNSGTPLVVSAAAATADTAVFAKIASYTMSVSDAVTAATADGYNTTYTTHLASAGLTVSDTATNVNGDLTNLGNLASTLNTVTVTGNATAAQAVAIAAGLTTHVGAGGINVSDTGANVVTSLGGLQTNVAKIGTITLSNSGTPLVVSAAAASADSAAITKIASYTMSVSDAVTAATADGYNTTYTTHLASAGLTVSDTATNVNGDLVNLGALGGTLNTVTVTGNATAAQAVAIAAGLTTHVGAGGINVSDTGANVVTSLGGLQTNVAKIGTITLSNSGTPLVVSAAAASADSAAIAKIATYTMSVSDAVTAATADGYNTTYTTHLASAGLTVSDTATNVNGDLTNLGNLASTLNTVTVTGNATAAQAVNIATNLTSHVGAGGINVSDTGANVVTSLGGLQTNVAKIGTITLSNSGTPLVVSAAAASADSAAITKIASYTMSVSDAVTAATADGYNTTYTTHLASAGLTVSDTATNVNGDLVNLGALGGTLNTVTVSGNATAAQAVAIAAGLTTHVGAGGINVSDTGANVVTSLGGLQTNVAKIGTITLSDSGTPLVVSAAAATADTAVFAKIATYTMSVSDAVTAATADGYNTTYTTHLASAGLTVSDTATNVNGDLTNLGNLASTLNTVTVTGNATAAQAVAIAAGLTTHVGAGGINVSDTGANVVTSLGGLQTNVAKIGTITLSNSGTPLVVSAAAASADSAAITKIASYTMSVSDAVTAATADGYNTTYTTHLASAGLTVSDTATNVNGDLVNLGALGGTLNTVTVSGNATAAQAVAIAAGLTTHVGAGGINVSDTGANVVTSLGGLQTNVAKIGTITLSNSGTPLVVSAAAASADSAAIAKIASYTMTVSDSVTTATADSLTTSYGSYLASAALTVSDTATNVNADLTNLGNLAAKLNTVTVTGNATAAQAVNIATNLTSHVGAGGINVSDTGANVISNLAPLNTYVAEIGSITLTDSATPLVVSETAATGDSAAITKIGTYTLSVSDTLYAATADAYSTTYAGHLAAGALTVFDAAAHVNADLTNLEHLGSLLNTVNLNDNATVAQALAIATGLTGHVGNRINISDTASNLMANLAGLQTLASATHLGTITMTSPVGAYSLTVAQANADPLAVNAIAAATGANANAVLYVQATSSANNSIDLSALTHVTDVSLYTNTATMSFTSGTTASITGTQNQVTLNPAAGAAASTVEYSSGVEVINNFQFGVDTLNFALGSYGATLTATDLTSNDVALTVSGGGTSTVAGVILRGIGSAATVNSHLFAAGNHAIVT